MSWHYPLVFLTGAGVLILEILGTRVLSPVSQNVHEQPRCGVENLWLTGESLCRGYEALHARQGAECMAGGQGVLGLSEHV